MERGERSIISNFLGKDSGNEMGLLGDRREGRRRDVRCHPGAVGRGVVVDGLVLGEDRIVGVVQ